VERRLRALADRLEVAERGAAGAAQLSRIREQLDRALAELRDLAAGLHPGGIEEGGLSAALASLAARSPVPVDLRVTELSLPEELERATYFVCSEALANVAKYADASQARVTVVASEHELRVRVADDGVGGADARRGSGLRGLADRVEALGGRLRVESPPGGGTRVEAILPTAGNGAF
jgi:signal transduction histidine kinase